jgi:hypothetical protein
MIRGLKTAFLLLLLGLVSFAHAAEEGAFLEIVRARIATLPALETSAEAGSPKFMVVRFNAPPILTAGERYGAVRLTCPHGKPLSLAWLFSDTTNIDEYGLLSREGARLEPEFSRFILPSTANADPEQEQEGRRASSLPRPWDLFQLHMLGVAARLLKPGHEYVIWFRFSDQRPTDLLLAATFLDPAQKLEPADLPPIFALPALGVP